jgi:hypothetical protein
MVEHLKGLVGRHCGVALVVDSPPEKISLNAMLLDDQTPSRTSLQ